MNTRSSFLASILLVVLCSSGVLSRDRYYDILIDIPVDKNKKKIPHGEPVIIPLRITSATGELVGLCNMSTYSVFSETHSRGGDSLWHDPETGTFLRNNRCYPPYRREGVHRIQPLICKELSREALMFDYVLNLPVLISDCPGYDNIECQGRYAFLLPVGRYRFTANLVFTNGEVFKVIYDFEIVKSEPGFKAAISEFAERYDQFYADAVCVPYGSSISRRAYDPEAIDPFFRYVAEAGDCILTAKSLIQMVPYLIRNEWFMRSTFDLLQQADEWSLYYFINQFAANDVLFRRDKEEALKSCDLLLMSLKNLPIKYSAYLLNRIGAKVRYVETDCCGRSWEAFTVTVDDLKSLQVYSDI